jgi:hypothetical protein
MGVRVSRVWAFFQVERYKIKGMVYFGRLFLIEKLLSIKEIGSYIILV